MSTTSRSGLRWAVPAGAAALVLGGAVLGPVLTASAEVELPERSAAQLLTDLQTADVDAFSGTVEQTTELGLPALPEGMGGEHRTDLLSLLDGTHTLRVWADGEKGRVALHGDLGEYGVVTDGTQVWTWSSDDRTATHLTLPDRDGLHDGEHGEGLDARRELPPVTPEQVTDMLLAALDPTTEVSTGPNVTVAGRPAYELVLEPEAGPDGAASLIGEVRVAVDAAELVPTRVRVVPAGSDVAAVDVGFTRLSFDTPDDDVFAFTPPAGATVEEHDLADHRADGAGERSDGVLPHGTPGEALAPGATDALGAGPAALRDKVAVVGEGWSAVLVTRAPAGGIPTGVDGDLGTFLEALPRVSGDWGSGRLLTSRLVSALLTDDGRLLVGAVGADALTAAAADPAAALG